MNRYLQTFLFRDLHKPLSTLAGVGLLIMASSRLAFGLIVALALFWVYTLTMITVFFAQPIYPKIGSKVIRIMLSSLLGSIFLLILWFISPLLALETRYLVLLVPCYCIGSPQYDRSLEISKLFFKTSTEAGSLGLLIIAFALIREPLGFMSLSLPGSAQGIIELFHTFEGDSFLPIKIIASSAGALLLLGYGVALFRSIRKPDS